MCAYQLSPVAHVVISDHIRNNKSDTSLHVLKSLLTRKVPWNSKLF